MSPGSDRSERRRKLGSAVLAGCAVIAALAAACNAPAQANNDNNNGKGGEVSKPPSKSTTNANTCLGKAKLEFAKDDCTSCMNESAGCCEATIACFKNDDDCSTLHSCMLACGGGTTGTPTDPGTGTATPTDPGTQTPLVPGSGKTIFTNEVFPLLNQSSAPGKPPCSSCHATGANNAPKFMVAGNADATYASFINQGFQVAGSALVIHGEHMGPALSSAEQTAIAKWSAAEMQHAIGDGTPEGSLGAETDACRAKCQADHPASVQKYQAYNTCAWTTCASTCR